MRNAFVCTVDGDYFAEGRDLLSGRVMLYTFDAGFDYSSSHSCTSHFKSNLRLFFSCTFDGLPVLPWVTCSSS